MNTRTSYFGFAAATILIFAAFSIASYSGAQTTTSTSVLTCSPATQTAVLGQSVSVTASGGTGSYTWSSPDLSISNPTGSGFSANFATTGTKTVTVSSGGVSASCAVTVLPATNGSTSTGGTPGLPDTGGGYGQS